MDNSIVCGFLGHPVCIRRMAYVGLLACLQRVYAISCGLMAEVGLHYTRPLFKFWALDLSAMSKLRQIRYTNRLYKRAFAEITQTG